MKTVTEMWDTIIEEACRVFIDNDKQELMRYSGHRLVQALEVEINNRRAGCPPMYRIDDVFGLWEIG